MYPIAFIYYILTPIADDTPQIVEVTSPQQAEPLQKRILAIKSLLLPNKSERSMDPIYMAWLPLPRIVAVNDGEDVDKGVSVFCLLFIVPTRNNLWRLYIYISY